MSNRNTSPQFNPASTEQEAAYKACRKSTITFLIGPAGSTKTYTAMAAAVDMLLNKEVDKIFTTRPCIEACGESIGYIPGSAGQKLGPYIRPLADALKDYAPNTHIDISESAPLAHIRGWNIKNSVAILDEAQNANMEQLELFITRLSRGSKLIICGDPDQPDIRRSPLVEVAEALSQIPGISLCKLTSVSSAIRHPMMPAILDAFRSIRK